MDTTRFRLGNPFDIPSDPDALELMVGWFFDRIRVICAVENHTMKFHSISQILEILREASEVERVNCTFSWIDGQWFLNSAKSKEDVLNLPKVAKRFSKIYRFHASDYMTGDKQDLKMLNGD